MNEKKDKDPIESLVSNYSELEKEGFRMQEQGRDIVCEAQAGKRMAEFLGGEIPKYKRMAVELPKTSFVISDTDNIVDIARQKTRESLDHLHGSQPFIIKAMSVTGTSVTMVNSLSANLSAGVSMAQATDPSINIYARYGFRDPFPLFRGDEEQLSRLLMNIDSGLEKMRKGAWDTFRSGSNESLSQASHTMREILRQLISKFASNEVIKNCKWWVYVPDTKYGVSVRQRLRFLLYGPEKEPNNDIELEVMEKQINKYFESYDTLQEVAHGSTSVHVRAVEESMRSVEELLLLILKRRIEEQNTR